MGGRWFITKIQVTFILKGELDDDEIQRFLEHLKEQHVRSGAALDILLDETQVKDVEV